MIFFIVSILIISYMDIKRKVIPSDWLMFFLFIMGIFINIDNLSFSLCGAFLGFGIGYLEHLRRIKFKKGRLGGGDVKFLAFIGLFLGYNVITVFIISMMMVYAIRKVRFYKEIPLVPFISFASIIIMIGEQWLRDQ